MLDCILSLFDDVENGNSKIVTEKVMDAPKVIQRQIGLIACSNITLTFLSLILLFERQQIGLTNNGKETKKMKRKLKKKTKIKIQSITCRVDFEPKKKYIQTKNCCSAVTHL